MATFRWKNGRFIKSTVHYRNVKTHSADKHNTIDHSYAAATTSVTESVSEQPNFALNCGLDINNVVM